MQALWKANPACATTSFRILNRIRKPPVAAREVQRLLSAIEATPSRTLMPFLRQRPVHLMGFVLWATSPRMALARQLAPGGWLPMMPPLGLMSAYSEGRGISFPPGQLVPTVWLGRCGAPLQPSVQQSPVPDLRPCSGKFVAPLSLLLLFLSVGVYCRSGVRPRRGAVAGLPPR